MATLRTPGDPVVTTPLPDVLQFMQLLWAVVHGLETTSKRMTHDVGVTGPQRLVLRVVGLFPGLSAGDLAAILHVHPSTLTGILRRLVQQRLLLRVEHARDRRRAVLRLTARGQHANTTKSGTVESVIAGALTRVSDADRRAAKRVLTLLAEHLEGPAGGRRRAAPDRGRSQARSQARGGRAHD